MINMHGFTMYIHSILYIYSCIVYDSMHELLYMEHVSCMNCIWNNSTTIYGTCICTVYGTCMEHVSCMNYCCMEYIIYSSLYSCRIMLCPSHLLTVSFKCCLSCKYVFINSVYSVFLIDSSPRRLRWCCGGYYTSLFDSYCNSNHCCQVDIEP